MSMLADEQAQRAAQQRLDAEWAELKRQSRAIVRMTIGGHIHMRTGAINAVVTVADLPGLEAAVAMLKALEGRR